MEEAYINSETRHEDMQKWFTYLRRHNANNIFDVFFKDKENISDEDIVVIIGDVAKFFGLPVPVIQDKCESIAKIMTSKEGTECELYYDWKLMEKAGINNVDTLRLSFVHELSHQTLFNTRFLLFENELWIQELAADLLVGGFSVLNGDVATGKYKFVVSRQKATLTHPDGELREKVVVYGRKYVEQLLQRKRYQGIKDILTGLPAFVYSHYMELQESWDRVSLEDSAKEPEPPAERKPIDYESLPDTNLLKQYWLKHKDDKKTEDEK